jgi:hypothetical protein
MFFNLRVLRIILPNDMFSVPFFVFVTQNCSVPAPSFFRVLLTQFIRHRRAIIYDNHICCAFGTLFAAIGDKKGPCWRVPRSCSELSHLYSRASRLLY